MSAIPTAAPARSLRPYLQIARFDHWVKNVFVLPGIVLGVYASPERLDGLTVRTLVGLLSVGLIASSNYVINEVMDAPFDRHHPVKSARPIPSGRCSIPVAYFEWILLMVLGMALALAISLPFAATMGFLWLMGVFYNIAPLRTKDVPYLDVISESVNNPIRLLAGWFITGSPHVAPGSLLVSYWMVGAYFMAVKRFAEYREIGNRSVSIAYRRSFAFYDEPRLLVSIMFYAAFAMLTFGAFIARYRLELALGFPFVALVMAIYLKLSFQPNSAVQNPEFLWKQRGLMICVVLCAIVLTGLMFLDIPAIYRIFDADYSGMKTLVR
jgi:4-hydroxybenzoate polyprenyltransferase